MQRLAVAAHWRLEAVLRCRDCDGIQLPMQPSADVRKRRNGASPRMPMSCSFQHPFVLSQHKGGALYPSNPALQAFFDAGGSVCIRRRRVDQKQPDARQQKEAVLPCCIVRIAFSGTCLRRLIGRLHGMA